jgi:hypothetical protein
MREKIQKENEDMKWPEIRQKINELWKGEYSTAEKRSKWIRMSKKSQSIEISNPITIESSRTELKKKNSSKNLENKKHEEEEISFEDESTEEYNDD